MAETQSPLRTVWRCAVCGSERVEKDQKTPMGQYATGRCDDCRGVKRPLVAGNAHDIEEMVERNAERRRIRTLASSISRGTVAPHSYVPGARPEGATKGSARPCAVILDRGRACPWRKGSHAKDDDLRLLRYIP